MNIRPEPTRADYMTRLAAMLADPKSRLYVDASFLIWALKLGPTAAEEMLTELARLKPALLHVPAWAAHEFHVHMRKESPYQDLKRAAKSLQKVPDLYEEVAGALAEVERPPQFAAGELRDRARAAALQLREIGQIVNQWPNSQPSDKTRERVIRFVNDHALHGSSMFTRLAGVLELATLRNMGLVPPGFADADKEGREGKNFAGDLIFWREVLEHARAHVVSEGLEGILVLTRDRKEDWVQPQLRERPREPELQALNREWGVVPFPHPTLEHEAGSTAGIKRLLLVTEEFLAAHLRVQNTCPTYVAAALPSLARTPPPSASSPPPPSPPPAPRVPTPGAPQASPAPPATPRASAPELPHTSALLSVAASPPPGELAGVLAHLLDISQATNLPKVIAEATPPVLVHLPRALLTKALEGNDSVARDLVSDVRACLPQTTGAQGTWLILGLLIACYCDPRTLDVLEHPNAALVNFVPEIEGHASAEPAIAVIRELASQARVTPIYLPNAAPTSLRWLVDLNEHTRTARSIIIGSADVFDPVTAEDERLLRKLVGNHETTTDTLMNAAARFYGIPRERLASVHPSKPVSLSETHGFLPVAEIDQDQESEE